MGIIHLPHSVSCCTHWQAEGYASPAHGYNETITVLLRDVEITFHVPCCINTGQSWGRISKLLNTIERYTPYRFFNERELLLYLNWKEAPYELHYTLPVAYESSYTIYYEVRDVARILRHFRTPRCPVCRIRKEGTESSWDRLPFCSWSCQWKAIQRKEKERICLRKNQQSIKSIRALLRNPGSLEALRLARKESKRVGTSPS